MIKVQSVSEFVMEHFKSQAQFCRAIGVHAQQYKEYEKHFVLIDESGKEKPSLFIRGKTVELDTP